MIRIKTSEETVIKIREMFKDGYKAGYIAKKLGVSRGLVYLKIDKSEKRAYKWREKRRYCL